MASGRRAIARRPIDRSRRQQLGTSKATNLETGIGTGWSPSRLTLSRDDDSLNYDFATRGFPISTRRNLLKYLYCAFGTCTYTTMDDSMDGRHGMGQSLWTWVCDTLTDYTRRRPQSEHGVQLGVYVHEKNAKDVRRILVALSQWQQTQEELFSNFDL